MNIFQLGPEMPLIHPQNQIIDILSNQIQQAILKKVKKAQWFTVIADEVTDLSNKELLSLVLRYVDHDTGLRRPYGLLGM